MERNTDNHKTEFTVSGRLCVLGHELDKTAGKTSLFLKYVEGEQVVIGNVLTRPILTEIGLNELFISLNGLVPESSAVAVFLHGEKDNPFMIALREEMAQVLPQYVEQLRKELEGKKLQYLYKYREGISVALAYSGDPSEMMPDEEAQVMLTRVIGEDYPIHGARKSSYGIGPEGPRSVLLCAYIRNE